MRLSKIFKRSGGRQITAAHPDGTVKCTCNHSASDHDSFGCVVAWCACCAMTPLKLWYAK